VPNLTRYIFGGALGGHLRLTPTIHGESVQIEIFGPGGGFHGAELIELEQLPAFQKALDDAGVEAERLRGMHGEVIRAPRRMASQVPWLGTH
jgi:hypothetical protein